MASEEIMAMKKIKPEAKKGKGQYTISRHSPSASGDCMSYDPSLQDVQLVGKPLHFVHGSRQAVQFFVVVSVKPTGHSMIH